VFHAFVSYPHPGPNTTPGTWLGRSPWKIPSKIPGSGIVHVSNHLKGVA
jgi:hypothetical protein